MTITTETLNEIERGLAGVTPGPWRVSEQTHPYGDKGYSHREQRISTEWDHPQLKGPMDITRLGIGVGLPGLAPIPMVRIEAPDAAHIARLDPDTVRELVRLARIGLEMQWRPIESAPKLERIFVAGWQPPHLTTRGYWHYGEDVTDENGVPMDHPQARLWMPLPALPQEADHG